MRISYKACINILGINCKLSRYIMENKIRFFTQNHRTNSIKRMNNGIVLQIAYEKNGK